MRKMTCNNSVIVSVMETPVMSLLLSTSLNNDANESAATRTPTRAHMAGM